MAFCSFSSQARGAGNKQPEHQASLLLPTDSTSSHHILRKNKAATGERKQDQAGEVHESAQLPVPPRQRADVQSLAAESRSEK